MTLLEALNLAIAEGTFPVGTLINLRIVRNAYEAPAEPCAHPFVLKSRAMSLGECPICLRADVERLTQERDYLLAEPNP